MLLNCALKLVEEIILYYDARSKKHQIVYLYFCLIKRKRIGFKEKENRRMYEFPFQELGLNDTSIEIFNIF